MKKTLLFLLCILTIPYFFCVSCSDDKEYEDTDEYYVHYIFPVYGSNVLYRDVNNSLRSGSASGSPFGSSHPHLDVTIGPVKKGFEAYLSGQNHLNPYSSPTMKIQVSKNNGAFVDKCSYRFHGSESNTLKYTIDF